jgi:hypothetical protein
MMTFKTARGAMMAAVLMAGTGAEAMAQAPQCGPRAAARLVCDQDGCVRPSNDVNCLVVASIVRAGKSPRRLALPVRADRDEVATLLARLN